jgi:hypothetical protein
MRPVTGVGSLPHLDPAAAAEFVLSTATVPYLPQLPARHPEEGMLLQWGDGLCGCGAGGAFGLGFGSPPGDRTEALVGAEHLLADLAGDTTFVKTQATGPITLAAAMLAGGHPGDGLEDCLIPGLLERVYRHLDTIRERLPGAEVLLIYDEPALAVLEERGFAVDEDGGLGLLAAALAATPVPAGVHCCGDAAWGRIAALRPDAISLDIAELGLRFVESVPALAEAVSAGTRMIWGAVPAAPAPLPDTEELVARLRRAEGTLVMAGADLRRLDEAWLTPACGLGALGVEDAAAVASAVGELAEALDG